MRELFAELRHHAANRGDPVAFDDGKTRLDFAGLAGRVAAAAEEIRLLDSHARVGILGGNRIEGVIGQLAVWHAGKIAVPLPSYLSVTQLRAIAADVELSHILAAPGVGHVAQNLEVPVSQISERIAPWAEPISDEAGQIIYTSGTTGRPKGVRLRSKQLLWSAQLLACATRTTRDDVYLSVLPLPLLLETICAIVIPVLTGARVRLEPALADSLDEIDGHVLARTAADRRPTCLVLVPHLLAEWLRAIRSGAPRPPDSLRFVALGGAPVSPALSDEAWRLGVPVHEGYGLSECGSVVALNLPGQRRPGTVGRPLPGLDVTIADDEIVVAGPAVMDGYVKGPRVRGAWHTGDAGDIDADGYLTVRGRRDHVLATPVGRNISPEWIEALLAADARVSTSMVTHISGPHLTALLVPAPGAEAWFDGVTPEDLGRLIAACCAGAPRYAMPRSVVVASLQQLRRRGVLTVDRRFRRQAALNSGLFERAVALPLGADSRELAT